MSIELSCDVRAGYFTSWWSEQLTDAELIPSYESFENKPLHGWCRPRVDSQLRRIRLPNVLKLPRSSPLNKALQLPFDPTASLAFAKVTSALSTVELGR